MAAAADYGQIRLCKKGPRLMIAKGIVFSACEQAENGVDGRREGLVKRMSWM
jgi:hypothetical protein